MKKTLVAAAVLASLGTAAFAQSSVTLYGRIDASIAWQKTSNVGFVPGVDANVGTQLRSGAHTGSRWGLSGKEDLGGGLNAIFTLEQGFNVDTGSASVAANQFHRQAFVGLQGGFGTLTAGRQYTITDQNYGAFDVFGLSGYSAHAYAFNTNCTVAGIGDCIGRQNNAIQYATPSMGGFGAKLMWAPGEDKAPGVSAGSYYGGILSYTAGPLNVGASWDSVKAAGSRSTTNHTIGASYDLGAARIYAMYEGGKNKVIDAKDTGYSLGAVFPLGGPSLYVSYARENQKIAGAKVSRTSAFSLMGQYPLSKRTYVYAAYLNGEWNPTAAGLATRKDRSYGLGVVHQF